MSERPVCPDCAVHIGHAHEDGCDVARCLWTGRQRLSCHSAHPDMGVAGPPYNTGVAVCGLDAWTGRWPGEAECEAFGWWARFTDNGWQPCPQTDGGAHPDLNRLQRDATWDPDRRKWTIRT